MKSKETAQSLKEKEVFLEPRKKEWSTRIKVTWLFFCLIVMGGVLPIILNYIDQTKPQGGMLEYAIFGMPMGILIGVTTSKIVTRWIEIVVIGLTLGIIYGISIWIAMNAGIIEIRAIPSFSSSVLYGVITYTPFGIFLFIISSGSFPCQKSKDRKLQID